MKKTHFEIIKWGNLQAEEVWLKEKTIPHKYKFCDGLMLKKGRELDFTTDTDRVTCKKCWKKIESYNSNRVDIPRIR